MKDLITIGLPSKGRLKDKAISFFNDKGLKILQSEKERNYFGTIENENNIKIIFLLLQFKAIEFLINLFLKVSRIFRHSGKLSLYIVGKIIQLLVYIKPVIIKLLVNGSGQSLFKI